MKLIAQNVCITLDNNRYSSQYTILGEGYACKLFDGCELSGENILASNGIRNGEYSYTKLDNDNAASLPKRIIVQSNSSTSNEFTLFRQ